MQRQSPWRWIAFAMALLIACIWAVGAGWYVSESWSFRHATARMELAREEIACGNRSASQANQQRCRDMAEIVSRAEVAERYFLDGMVVFGPALVLLGVAFWFRRGGRGGRNDHRGHHHDRPSAA